MSVVLRARDGSTTALPVADWCAPATAAELALLERLDGPVLDLGCGPGRLVSALGARGVAALGVDVSLPAIAHAEARGAAVLHRSLFDRLPGEGRWRAAVLFDGNVGIGGDPIRLLRRVAHLLGRGGRALVEVGAPGVRTRLTSARLERGDETTPWFPWAWVGVDTMPWFTSCARLDVVERHHLDERWFTVLEHVR
jgi:SAM-dependent methyltransferase